MSRTERCASLVLIFLNCFSASLPATTNPETDLIVAVQEKYAAERYQEIVDLTEQAGRLSPELTYYRGMALAHLERWEEAKGSLKEGERLAPKDKRFPLELAGISFKQNNYSMAKRYLHRALSLDPKDSYGLDFLGTIYQLEGNLEAALKYWNRIEKPTIHEIKYAPPPRVNPALLKRAFAFSENTPLSLKQLQTTKSHLDSLEIFPRYGFELVALKEENFDVLLHPVERNGWGSSWKEGLISLFRGIPYETIHPEFFNLKHSALNSVSLIRWDSEKQRAFTSFSGPLKGDPKWRYRLEADGRKENWDLTNSFHGPIPPEGDLLVKKFEAGAEVETSGNGIWGWRSAVYFAHRDFGKVIPQVPGATELFDSGDSLKYVGGVNQRLLSVPEHRLTTGTFFEAEVGKTFTDASNFFSQLQVGADFQWLPLPVGDDYTMNARLRAGKSYGEVPFDELFTLGVVQDNDLWLRAHNGIREKKGHNPLGRDYVLVNWEINKIVYKLPLFQIRLSPFLDTGRIYDVQDRFGSEEWLWDVGLQCKIRLLDSVTLSPIYGRDLRSGNSVFYLAIYKH